MAHPVDMITAHGYSVWFKDPSRTHIDSADLKTHTTNICRYNGAVQWSLVRHLALCVRLARKRLPTVTTDFQKLQPGYCASHDFQEVYLGDVVTGLKNHLTQFQALETEWEEYVHDSIGLPLKHRDNKFVKWIDQRALVVEMKNLKHPAAPLVANKYDGNPTAQENEAFIQTVVDPDPWDTVWKAVQEARTQIMMME